MLPCVGSTKDRVLMTSKCGEGEKVVHEAEPSELLMFLLVPHLSSTSGQNDGNMKYLCFVL